MIPTTGTNTKNPYKHSFLRVFSCLLFMSAFKDIQIVVSFIFGLGTWCHSPSEDLNPSFRLVASKFEPPEITYSKL